MVRLVHSYQELKNGSGGLPHDLLRYLVITCCSALTVFVLTLSGRALLYSTLAVCGLMLALALSVVLRQSGWVRLAVFCAFLVRICLIVAFVVLSTSRGGAARYLRSGDATSYHEWAQYVVGSGDWRLWGGLPTYTYMIAAIYRAFGPDPNVVDLVNVGVSLLVIVFVSELGRRCGGRRAGIVSAWLVALHPSLALWSISGVKDVWIVLGAVLSVFLATGLAAGRCRTSDVVKYAVGAPILVYLRFQLVLSLVLALGLTVFLYTGRSAVERLALVLAFLVIGSLTLFSPLGQSALLMAVRLQEEDTWQRSQDIALAGGSGIPFLSRIPGKFRWIAQFPFVILAPFPWQWISIGSGVNRLAAIEMLAWYVIVALLLAKRRLWQGDPVAGALFAFAVSIALAVSFSLPNLGSIHRYRVAGMVMILPVAARVIVMKRRDGVTC